jgi:hypothetical protein
MYVCLKDFFVPVKTALPKFTTFTSSPPHPQAAAQQKKDRRTV